MGRLTYTRPRFYTEDQGSMFLHSVRSLDLYILVSMPHRFGIDYFQSECWNFMRLLLCNILLGCDSTSLFFRFLNPATIGNMAPCS
jgi:hypothetical protein